MESEVPNRAFLAQAMAMLKPRNGNGKDLRKWYQDLPLEDCLTLVRELEGAISILMDAVAQNEQGGVVPISEIDNEVSFALEISRIITGQDDAYDSDMEGLMK